MSGQPKQYDRAYFDRWYRDPRRRVISPAPLARRASWAIATAEYVLGPAVADRPRRRERRGTLGTGDQATAAARPIHRSRSQPLCGEPVWEAPAHPMRHDCCSGRAAARRTVRPRAVLRDAQLPWRPTTWRAGSGSSAGSSGEWRTSSCLREGILSKAIFAAGAGTRGRGPSGRSGERGSSRSGCSAIPAASVHASCSHSSGSGRARTKG